MSSGFLLNTDEARPTKVFTAVFPIHLNEIQ